MSQNLEIEPNDSYEEANVANKVKRYFKKLLAALKAFEAKPNIRERLTLQILLLVSILFLSFSISIYFFSRLYLEKRFFERLQDRAITSSLLFFDFDGNNNLLKKFVDKKDDELLSDEVITIYDAKRSLFVFSTNLRQEAFHTEFLKLINPKNRFLNLSLKGHRVSSIKISDDVSEYWVTVSAIDNLGEEALKDLKNILFIISIVALLFITFLGWYLANKAFSPLFSIMKQLSDVFPGSKSTRILHYNDFDEIGELTNNINQLLERAESSVNTQKLFVANISHEIKNPLTTIFTQIEVLEMKYKKEPEFLKHLVSLKEDTVALNTLANEILHLANLFSDESKLPMTIVRIDEVVWEAISNIKKWNKEYKIIFKADFLEEYTDKLNVMANADALKIVFKNLIDNACKFSSDNTATVELNFSELNIKVKVKNNGELIPKEDLLNVFQPFFRGNATAKGKKGHGVGLAIVHQIVKLHLGKIKVYTSEIENIFEVSFPFVLE